MATVIDKTKGALQALRIWPLIRTTTQNYDGLRMRCAPGTHEAALRLLQSHEVRTANVLDIAAGTGAWLHRLERHGFTEIAAIELERENFALPHIKLVSVDLNSSFGRSLDRTFSLVTAIEIVEHLDCPRSFLRQVEQLVESDGFLLLTIPNIAHWMGRLRFLLTGELRYFREKDYHDQRHISPITDTHLRLMLEESGFELKGRVGAGSFNGPLLRLLMFLPELLFRIFLGRRSTGDVRIVLAKKVSESSKSQGRDSYYFERWVGDDAHSETATS